MDIVLAIGLGLLVGGFAGMGWGYALGVLSGQKQLGEIQSRPVRRDVPKDPKPPPSGSKVVQFVRGEGDP